MTIAATFPEVTTGSTASEIARQDLTAIYGAHDARPVAPKPARRRGTAAQGRALEALGHAVEYLVDSRLFMAEPVNQRDEQETVQTLMRLSRAVFADCVEVTPLSERMRRRLGRLMPMRRAA